MKRVAISRRQWGNIGTAVLAILLSLVVWVSASYANDRPRVGFYEQVIPIEVINIPENLMLVNSLDKTTRVRIRTFESSWGTLTAGSFKAVVDLSGYSAGVASAPLKVTCTEQQVSILDTQPASVYVELDEMLSVTLPVEARLDNIDDLPLGYSASISAVTPASVTVEGPAALVTNVVELRVPVSLVGQRTSMERTVDVQALDRNGQPILGLTLSPSAVQISVSIERMLNYRDVAVRALTSGHPANGYYIAGVSVDPGTVTLVGPPTVVAAMPGLVSTLGVIDVTAATKTIVQRMPLDLPEGVSVYSDGEQQRQDVFVTIEIAPVMGGSNIELPLEVRKLGDGLAATLSVPAVDVIITGPTVILERLTIDLVDAYVDLGGLGVGKHQVKPIVSVMVSQLPDLGDLTVTSVSPEFVEVEITGSPSSTSTPPSITPSGAQR